MAFDHGAPKIIPANLVLIALLSAMWWSIAPWWVIVPVALLVVLPASDKYGGMFLCFIFLMEAFWVSLPVTTRIRKHDGDVTTILISGLINMAMAVAVTVVVLGGISWWLYRKYEIWIGKKVTLKWGRHKGRGARIESIDQDTLVVTVSLRDNDEIVRYPANAFDEEPQHWKGREQRLPSGTKIRILFGKMNNCEGTVVNYLADTHVAEILVEASPSSLWYASNLIEPVSTDS
jgi:hypothetical protein